MHVSLSYIHVTTFSGCGDELKVPFMLFPVVFRGSFGLRWLGVGRMRSRVITYASLYQMCVAALPRGLRR